jgi:hypothetical protein
MRDLRHMLGRKEICAEFLWGNLKERERLQDVDIDGTIILKCILRRTEWRGLYTSSRVK